MYPVSELIVISVKGSEPLYPLPLCSGESSPVSLYICQKKKKNYYNFSFVLRYFLRHDRNPSLNILTNHKLES
jgi:hypothetical protein